MRIENKDIVSELKEFAENWNKLYAETKFEEMKFLATEDVGIANTGDPRADAAGLIIGRQAYFDGIYGTYYGSDHIEENILVMDYENWEYISVGNDAEFYYTIGKYTIFPSDKSQKNIVGVNCWLLRREAVDSPWLVYRVINN